MDYREKYEEALERAHQIHNEDKAQCFDVMTKVFPELAKVDDEKIRKWLINLVKSHIRWLEDRIKEQLSNGQIYGGELSKAQVSLAWLEKQEKLLPKKDVDDAYLKGVCDTKQELENRKQKKLFPKLSRFYAHDFHSEDDGLYWWEYGDWKGGRMQFLDWLIEEYKDNKENLRNIKF